LLVIVAAHSLASWAFLLSDDFFELKLQRNCIFQQTANRDLAPHWQGRLLVVSGLINGHGCFAAAMASNVAHRSTAPRGAAATGIGTLEAVINGQLLACPDFSETVKEDLAADFAHGQIRIAAMIDELGTTSSH
jgi:hypothetical protein